MGSGPLAQPLFYQYKCTLKKSEPLRCNGSKQSRAMRWRLGKRSEQGPHSARNKHPAAQPRAQTSGLTPGPSRLKAAAPPQPRENCLGLNPITGPGAEGGGGWPMHATAQPWHAEGRPSTTAARGQHSQYLQRSSACSVRCPACLQRRAAPVVGGHAGSGFFANPPLPQSRRLREAASGH